MATSKGKKISELDSLQEFTGAEMIPLAINGSNYSCTSEQLRDYIGANCLKIDENGNVELPNNSITLGDETSEIIFGPLSISPVYQNFIGMYFTKLYSRFSGKEILRIEDDYGEYQVLSVDVYTSFNDTVQTKTIKTQGIKISESGPYLDIAGSSTGVSLHLYKSNGTSTFSNLVFTLDGVDCRGAFSAATFKKHSGTSTQFLKADGSVDETEYLSANDLLTADEANTLYDNIYQEILEQYDEEQFPSPLTSDMPSPTTLDNDEYEQ